MQPFEQLRVWQLADEVAMDVFLALEKAHRRHGFALQEQLRRSALSVAANIVEGSSLASPREYARHLNIAQGSLAETQYLLMAARKLQLIEGTQATRLISKVQAIGSMLHNLRQAVQQRAA